ncbi:hypothetical protein LY76DRAFT_586448 [Colletotrichum caudatum]|nr:hypothetical protein LY76DRAFT_586448 [Colletotrichum caudatum]
MGTIGRHRDSITSHFGRQLGKGPSKRLAGDGRISHHHCHYPLRRNRAAGLFPIAVTVTWTPVGCFSFPPSS